MASNAYKVVANSNNFFFISGQQAAAQPAGRVMETLPAGRHHPKDQRLLPEYQTVQGPEWGEGPVRDTSASVLTL